MQVNPRWFENLTGARILAVNPPVYDFAWFDLWAKPLGLLNFLAWLRQRGNRVQLLDCLYEGRERPLNYGRWKVRRQELDPPAALGDVGRRYYRFGLDADEFKARLKDLPRPEVILVTSIMTYWYPGVAEAIRALRSAFPGRPVILGGIYATLCPEHAAGLGADQVLPAAAAPRGDGPALDLYPEPGHAIATTSHGCPHHCHYCASAILQPHFTPRALKEVINDLDRQLASGQVRDLAFYDDALLESRNTILYPLAEHLAEHRPGLRLHSPNGLSVKDLDADCCRRLRRAGFKTLRLSFEGLDRHTRKASGDKVNATAYQQAVTNLRQAGFNAEEIETYLLLGLPGQKIEDIEESIEYVKTTGAKPKLCEYSPIPGTRLFQTEAETHPQILTEPLWHNNSIYTTHLAERLEPSELQRLKTLSRTSTT